MKIFLSTFVNKVPTKLAILSSLQFIFMILIVVLGVITKQTFDVLGWGVDLRGGFTIIPSWIIVTRFFLIFSVSIFLVVSLVSLHYNIMFRDYNKWFSYFFLFNWLFAGYFIYLSIISEDYKNFINHENYLVNKEIENSRKLLIYKIMIYLLVLVSNAITIWLFVVLNISRFNDAIPTTAIGPWFSFGWIANILFMLYMLFLPFFNKTKFYNSATPLIILLGYITMVVFYYWVVILPTGVDKLDSSMAIANAIFIHLINPIIFIIASIFLIKTRGYYLDCNFKQLFAKGIIIPSIVMLYTFLAPSICQISIYGYLSNTNPEAIMYIVPDGNVWNICLIFALIPSFALSFLPYYFIFSKN